MFHFMNFVRPFVNYAIFRELCDRMRFEVDCAKSHHRVIPEGLSVRNKALCQVTALPHIRKVYLFFYKLVCFFPKENVVHLKKNYQP